MADDVTETEARTPLVIEESELVTVHVECSDGSGTFDVKFTHDELVRVEAAARKAGMTLEHWILKCGLAEANSASPAIIPTA